ncbi:glycosyltransferase family 2 protein [Candidatus Cetobacterium colombiensis]|uniref:Glycosyltransferase family 2 protein n=1 Tax=Candidatus Cetobacterium colombiensis TaxID=3073100 RepID=A0ABU4W8H4_9FUSO|nr:glycosyltransferase family 2 protein [Candidatus Cetobacterium colombiensis]MDX8334911.1 glycosyltransferase family 2 protein [Candidatus Cetobacterium colombiensis]
MKENYKNPMVSIIIPTYKRETLIKKAIENLKKQTYKNLEIIVVNDNGIENNNCKERTYLEIKSYLDKKEIVYIELENNLGGALARNKGIEIAKGKYISFFDDDDEYHPDKIKLQVENFEKIQDNNIAFIKSEMDLKLDGKIISTTKTKKYFEGNLLKNHILNLHGIVGTISFLFRTDVLKEVNGFSKVSIRQEYMLILKILLKGYKGIHLDKNLVTLNCTGESITRTKNEKKVKCMEKVLTTRLTCTKLTKKEKKFILKNHYLDLAEWYCFYKKTKCLKYSFLGFQLNKNIIISLFKINLKNIFQNYYLRLRKLKKGY